MGAGHHRLRTGALARASTIDGPVPVDAVSVSVSDIPVPKREQVVSTHGAAPDPADESTLVNDGDAEGDVDEELSDPAAGSAGTTGNDSSFDETVGSLPFVLLSTQRATATLIGSDPYPS